MNLKILLNHLHDILYRLANDYSIVLLSGDGFDGPLWSVRVSLANLDSNCYFKIGQAIREILNSYVDAWKLSQKQLATCEI